MGIRYDKINREREKERKELRNEILKKEIVINELKKIKRKVALR